MGTYDATLGPLFESVVLTTLLYGGEFFLLDRLAFSANPKMIVSCLQVWLYFRKYGTKDSWVMRTAVALVMIFDTCQQAMNSATVYFYVVTGHDDPTILLTLYKPLIAQAVPGALVALFVQLFFVWRIWKLSNGAWYGYPITGFLAVLTVASFAVLITYFVKAVALDTVPELSEIETLTTTANVIAAVTDIAISCAIIFMLNRARTGFRTTNSMINRLVTFSLNTGLVTSVDALIAAITLKVWPNTYIYMLFYLMLGRLYTNSLMATLNSREYIRGTSTNPNSSLSAPQAMPLQSVNRQFPQPHISTFTSSPGGHGHDGDHIAIRIDTIAQTDAQSDKDYYGEAKADRPGRSRSRVESMEVYRIRVMGFNTTVLSSRSNVPRKLPSSDLSGGLDTYALQSCAHCQSPPRSDVPLAKAANQEGGQVRIRIQNSAVCVSRYGPRAEPLGGARHVEHE
ncbi:uncharacterized protein STEHIDRAFT_141116 [Stereum hirsutum FP-91666 SS1]|uniref:uncharacterized protein n=1 Tax=Stereum hirsutum (strain FP-91666) TaxID=721885 RepID=UPI0004449270|nr:uncharacterized protein STEHIDRAFT_141116 [Stereum hirsutum FP-91666 SS1]EIM83304.1 hypothetical protein STEHIDRAFT_141116 [Stereum hirsutum FP-91666 SS1]